jgi:hypothetical protein
MRDVWKGKRVTRPCFASHPPPLSRGIPPAPISRDLRHSADYLTICELLLYLNGQ